jgi:hypothetical protein
MAWWPIVTPLPMRERIAHVGVHHRAFLDVAVFADRDALVVAANRHAEPHRGMFASSVTLPIRLAESATKADASISGACSPSW